MTKPRYTIPTSDVSLTWKDEDWVHFEDAAEAYANFIEVSTGVAQRLLREQCANGNIRSIRYTYEPADERPPVVLLKPSEWIENPYIDFQAEYIPEGYWGHADDPEPQDPEFPWTYIDVSQDDVAYWIIQARPKVSLPPSTRQGKVPGIKALLAKLYPDGVPEPGLCSRKVLLGQLRKADPTLASLDPKTLKTAITEHNADVANGKRQEGKGSPAVSD